MEKKKSFIIEGEHRLEIEGYRISYCKTVLTWIGVLLTCGVLWIAMSWKKRIYMFCSHTKCDLKEAEKLLLVDNYNQDYVMKVETIIDKNQKRSRRFHFKKLQYRWDERESTFVSIGGLRIEKCCDFYRFDKGFNTSESESSLQYYGKNSIRIEVKPVIKLILREVVNPFYIYQVFIVIVWFLQLYYQFGICIIGLSIISVSATVWETRKQSRSLRDAMKSESTVTVLRDGEEKQVPSYNLVPGDVMILSSTTTSISCDSVLISGNCVVNESMLTGESIPITKVPVSENDVSVFDYTTNKRNILSCGTELLLCRNTGDSAVKAIVYRTGFATAKGELVRAILYPKPVKIKLHTDLLKCMVIFFLLGIPALIYTGFVTTARLEAHPWDTALFLLNVITFFVPPALPAVLTSINEQAQRRLRKEGIYCLNTRCINVAGGLDVVCFDKTGTLTEDSLDISVIVPTVNGRFGYPLKEIQGSSLLLERAFACCHSLSNIDGKLAGYDLDIKMLKAVGWKLQEPTSEDCLPFEFLPPRIVLPDTLEEQQENSGIIALAREFPFESTFKRMTVVAKCEQSESFEVFLKGAPEVVASLCRNKTIPEDLTDVLQSYSSQGFRVIGFASKTLYEGVTFEQIQKMPRQNIENNMDFLGLLVLENKLKKETIPALSILKEANIRMIMVTGDNLLTGVTVSKNCGIVDQNNSVIIVEANTSPDINSKENSQLRISYKYVTSSTSISEKLNSTEMNGQKNAKLLIEHGEMYNIAMEGDTFNCLRAYDEKLLEKMVLKGAVFARMSPEHKLYLIEMLQNLGYQVGMCGDGANDCGALKTANTGVSLSMAEASVAAPFTSTQQNVQCISTLIREGRATLVSTFDAFRYMVCYTFMFLVAILMLQWDGQRPSDGAYVLIDVILNLSPPFLFGATGAYRGLVKNQPSRSILSFIPLFSIISYIFFQICTMAIVYEYCISQPWYEEFIFDKKNSLAPKSSHSGTTILTINMMCYITAAIIFASGRPYRGGFLTNKLYVAVVVVQFVLVGYIFIYPPSFLLTYLNFKEAPTIIYNLNLYGISLIVMVFCFIWEKCFVQRFLAAYVIPAIKKKRGPVRKYDKLLKKLSDESWIPMMQHNEGSSNNHSKVICSIPMEHLSTVEKDNL